MSDKAFCSTGNHKKVGKLAGANKSGTVKFVKPTQKPKFKTRKAK